MVILKARRPRLLLYVEFVLGLLEKTIRIQLWLEKDLSEYQEAVAKTCG